MTTATCTHHFVLESPNGELCQGTCKHCGETRTYATAGTDSAYYEDLQAKRFKAGDVIRQRYGKGGAVTSAQQAQFRGRIGAKSRPVVVR